MLFSFFCFFSLFLSSDSSVPANDGARLGFLSTGFCLLKKFSEAFNSLTRTSLCVTWWEIKGLFNKKQQYIWEMNEDEDTANNIKQQRLLHKIIETIISWMPLIHIVMSQITYLVQLISLKNVNTVVVYGMFNVCI